MTIVIITTFACKCQFVRSSGTHSRNRSLY